jgi:dienelactone hydrolase
MRRLAKYGTISRHKKSAKIFGNTRDMANSSTPLHSGRHDFTDGAQTLRGYIAAPSSEWKGPRPVVLVAHAWQGQCEFAREKAHMLADLGYVGFALDVYGDGRLGSSPEENSALMTPWIQDRAALRRRLLAAVTAARALPGVDADRVGVIGFCFGGLCAFDLARANAPGLRAAIGFHGLFMPPNLGAQDAIHAKVLALHGYDDPMAKPDAMVGFADEMTRAHADWQVVAYGATGHAFTNPHAHDHANGLFYREVIANRAFGAMRALLAEALA